MPKLLNMFANSAPSLDRKRLAEVLHNELMMRVINPSLAEWTDDAQLRSATFQESLKCVLRSN